MCIELIFLWCLYNICFPIINLSLNCVFTNIITCIYIHVHHRMQKRQATDMYFVRRELPDCAMWALSKRPIVCIIWAATRGKNTTIKIKTF